MKSPRRSSMPWVWSACSCVKRTASSQSTSASRSCSRRSGEVSTNTRVTPAPLRRSTRSDVRRRRFLGLLGLQAPQPSAGRGTPPEEPEPRIVKLAVMAPCAQGLRRPPERVRAGRLWPDFAEQAKKVLARLPGNRLQRDAADFGQDLGGLDHISRLIALSPIRTGGEIGRIRLDQEAVRRQALRDRTRFVRPLESYDPGKRDEETERNRAAREIVAAREAMQDRGEGALPRFLLQYSRHVLVRLARMNDERQVGCARNRDVIAEALFLRLARASLVVISEPGFSDCDHFWMARAADQLVDGDVEFLVRVMGMRAERAVDVGKALGDVEHLGMSFDSRRDGHN